MAHDLEVAPAPRRGRGRPRDPLTDGRIIRAAAELLLQNGFDKTTVDDVAARAGVGKATVYRRWPSKEDLAVAAMESLYDSEFPEIDTGSLVADLTESYRAILAFVGSAEGEAFIRMSISESMRDPRIAALYRGSTVRREEQARRTFERAVARGEVRADADLDTAIQWMGGVIVARAIVGRPLPTIDDLDRYVDFTLRGILDVSRMSGSSLR
ncbi:TetR/AcrR family transcriptional regulator [Nocardioides mesophilus]|uniref:TetR/AcrR family transcriptional regulator n=1 Tax=Nocardioides mesophilus TaxID=433659 RepID=A0A7G9R950_9ACTN|nr:TetR/AcrR family transcriptional regulator [Nocardioides mesophilus]QNN52125.1 TetR/AcrR family transcriptional regulator [Nocardioides mesophilus]